MMEIGDGVKWTYCDVRGVAMTLCGRVVEVVPSGQLPSDEYKEFPSADHHNRRMVESYVVKDSGGRIFRPSIKLARTY